MSLGKVVPQKTAKIRQSSTTGYKATVIENHYQNDLALKTGQEFEMALKSQSERHLHMDELCKNTMENLYSTIAGEEKVETRRQKRVWSCSVVVITLMVCLLSLISMVLTLLMFTGHVGTRCSCESDSAKPLRIAGHSLMRDKDSSGSDFERWLIDALRNITLNMDDQSRNFQELKDDFINMNEKRDKSKKRIQESVQVMKEEFDSKISIMETTMTDIRSAVESLNQSITKQAGRKPNINGMDLKIDKLQTTLNKTAEEFYTTTAKLQQDLQEVYKNGTYQLNLTKDGLKSSLQEMSSEILETKTYLTKQINETKRSIETSSSILHKHIKDLNETLLTKIENITKMEGLRCHSQRNNGSGGVTATQGLPGVSGFLANATNVSQCQYKVKRSPGTRKDAHGISVDILLIEPKDKRIVGSTCSTNGAMEYNFNQFNITGRIVYQCICKGKSSLFRPSGDKIYCYLHYWECPITT